MPNVPQETVLVVDDSPENIVVLDGILQSSYRVRVATGGEKALTIARSDNPPDIILLDVMMPGMDGFEVCRNLKSHPGTRSIPLIFVTAMGEPANEELGLSLGAVDYIHKPITPAIVLARVRTQLALHNHRRQLESLVKERTRELESTRLEIIRQLGRAAEFKDNQTGLHVVRMSHYCRILAVAAGLELAARELIFQAAPMHDIGKIGIPDAILTKNGPLTEAEWAIMKKHPELGAVILGEHTSPLMVMAREIALCHHERWNGTGYPAGLRGEAIPLSARIVALADVFDALTTARPYKRAWTTAEAQEYIQSEAGRHFDPDLARHFLHAMPDIEQLRLRYAETSPHPYYSGDWTNWSQLNAPPLELMDTLAPGEAKTAAERASPSFAPNPSSP